MLTLPKRKKTNFMVNLEILEDIKQYLPEGERSDFVNGCLEDALTTFKRKKASQLMDEMREKLNIKLTTKEIIKLKNYGRDK